MLKFGPAVLTRFLMLLAEPCAPTTPSVWQPEQWSRNRTAPRRYGLDLATLIPCDPHAPSATAGASRSATVAAIFALRLMRGGIYSSGGHPARPVDSIAAVQAALTAASPL